MTIYLIFVALFPSITLEVRPQLNGEKLKVTMSSEKFTDSPNLDFQIDGSPVQCRQYPICSCNSEDLDFFDCSDQQGTLTFTFIKRNLQTITNLDLNDDDMKSTLYVGDKLVLKWKFNEGEESFEMVAEWSQRSWFGVAFGPGMDQVDMLIFFTKDNQTVTVQDSWSTKKGVRPQADQISNIQVLQSIVHATGYKVRFKRQMNTGDIQDAVLKRNTNYTFAYAHSGAQQLQKHTFKTFFYFPFQDNLDMQAEIIHPINLLLYVHAIVMFGFWGILADVSILVVRFFKYVPYYLTIHTWCGYAINCATFVMVLVMVLEVELRDEVIMEAHFAIAITLVAAVILQTALGVALRALLLQSTRSNKQIAVKFRNLHKFLGISMYLLAKANIIVGTYFNQQDLLIQLNFSWLACLVAQEMYQSNQMLDIFRSKIRTNKVLQQQANKKLNQQQLKLLKLLNSRVRVNEIIQQLPNMLWVTLNADVFDLTGFQHPGGNFIIQNVVGREIGRFFYGAHALEMTSMEPHTHSQSAYDVLATRYIGTIGSEKKQYSNRWTIANKRRISRDIFYIELKQPGILISLHQNISRFGQHYSISLDEFGGKVRTYTKVLSMSRVWNEYRLRVIDFYHKTLNFVDAEVPKLGVSYSETVPLIIKVHEGPGAISQKLRDSYGNVYMEGPFGNGLELFKNMKLVGLSGGTGILPFIDLIDHLLFKSIYMAIKKKFPKKAAELFNQHEELGDNFEFHLIAQFQQPEDFIGKEWIQELYRINQDFNFKFFSMKVRFSNGKQDPVIPNFQCMIPTNNQERIATDSYVKELGGYQKYVYVCGPPDFNHLVYHSLKNSNQNQERIRLI